ncbi:MAG: sortase, partial [Acidimicrobiia bacterium]
EHTALLEGLGELANLEQRLRQTVATSHERISAVLDQSHDPGTPNDAGSVASGAPVPAIDLTQGAGPAPMGDLDLDAPVVGADDSFFADLRQAVDGGGTIAGRTRSSIATPSTTSVAAPVTPPSAALAPPIFAMPTRAPERPAAPQSPTDRLHAAAQAATAAVAVPMSLTDPSTDAPPLRLRSVPPIPPVIARSPQDDPFLPTPEAPTEPLNRIAPPLPGVVTEAPGSSRRERVAKKRGRWATAGTALRNLGILLLLFVAFQLWGTSALEHRDQAKLRRSFQVALASQVAPSTALPADADPSTVTTPTTVVAPPAAPSGAAAAVIKIPKIGVEQAVVEGTGVGDLRKGPGHYRNTPLPGQPGNAAIAGHRTTYGAPFNRIDELAPGDPILVSTLQGNFKYVVSEAPFPVSPSKNDVLFNKDDNRLTLTTCHPKYSAAKRLIVVAKLAPNETPAPAAKVASAPKAKIVADASTGGDAGAVFPALFWAALCGLAYGAMVLLSRRWVRRAALLLGTPVVLALLFPFFEQLSRLLPANY